MPPAHRVIWRAMHDHYVFGRDGDPAAHLAPEHRDRRRDVTPEAVAGLKAALADLLDGPAERKD
jgi:hypothetical protein